MKVSNNALNFLLAQYRAIFKRAYVKGLASAVLLTAGLAACQAQAANITDDNAATELADGKTVTINGGDTKLTISGNGTPITWDAGVTVTSGAVATPDNYIQASGGNVSISGTGSLTIDVGENDATTQGLAIKGGTGSTEYTTSVTLGKIDVVKGTLAIADGASGSTTVAAGSITIGAAPATGEDEGVVTQATDATQAYVNVTSSAKDVTFGATGSTITVNQGGQLSLSGSTGNLKVVGDTLALNNGAILLIDGTTSSIETTNLNIASGAVGVVKGSATGEFAGSTATVAGNLLVNGTLDINTTPATGTVTLAYGSNTVISGTVNVNSGTVVVESDAALNAANGTATGLLAIKDATADDQTTTLKISADTLKKFLNGGETYDVITEAGAIDGTNTGATGKLQLSGSILDLTSTGDTPIDLATEFKFSGSAQAGMIYVEGESTIKGDNILISKQLNNGAAGTITGSTGKIKIEATSLTLGNGGTAASDYGFKSATVRNLYGKTTDSIALAGAVTLDVTTGTSGNVDVDKNGVFSGDFILDDSTNGKLTVAHGTYTHEGSLTISGGSLTVQNEKFTDPNAKNIDTKLTLDKLSLHASGSTITVDGKNNDAAATILDISETTLNVYGHNSTSGSIVVQSGGTLLTSSENLDKILNSEGDKGFAVKVDKGTLEVNDDLSINAEKLAADTSTFSDKKLTFNKTNGGTLLVNGELALDNITAAIDLGTATNVSADELTFDMADAQIANAAVLSGGNFTAWSGLSSNSTKGIEVSGATLLLGGFDENGNAISSNGTLKTNLNIKEGTVTVQNGSWNGSSQSLTIAGGTFTVGDAENVDAAGNTFATSLSLNKIEQTGASANTTISTVGSVTTNSLKVSDGTFTVNGAMIVNGDYTAAVDSTPASYGVVLTSTSGITLGENAKLTFGAEAVKAITVNKSADASVGWIDIAENTFGAGNDATAKVIGVDVGSTVTFNFDSGTSFGDAALKEFRKEIFGQETTLDGYINLGSAKIDGLTVENGEVKWSNLQNFIDTNSDYTTELLQEAKVTEITTDAELRGSLGSLSSNTLAAGAQIKVDGNLALNNAAGNDGAFASNANGDVLGLNITENVQVNLNNGGEIGTVTFSSKGGSLVVASTGAATTIAAIDGAKAGTSFTAGTATVTGTTDTAQLTTAAGTQTTFTGVVTVGDKASGTDYAGKASTLAGNTTFQAAATFAQDAVVESTGSADFAGDVTFEGTATLNGDTTVDGTATAQNGLTVDQGANVVITTLETSGDVFVGSVTANGHEGATGTLSVETLRLNGHDLVVDPDWNNADGLAFVGVNQFSDGTPDDGDAGILQGKAFALQNSILSIGNKNKDEVLDIFGKYINAQGNLSDDKDGVGAIVYVADTVEVAANGKIVADKTQNRGAYDDPTVAATYSNYGVYIGDNSVLGVKVSAANGADAAITFAGNNDVTIKATNSGKIVLTGDYDQNDTINLFADKNGTDTVTIADGKTIRVETINGLLVKDDFNGQAFNISDMDVDTKRAASAFSATSSPVHDSLVAYGTGNTDWRHDATQTAEEKQATKTHGGIASGIVFFNNTYYYASRVEGQDPTDPVVDPDKLNELTTVKVENPDYDPQNPGSVPQYLDKVVYKAYNPLLSAINNQQANSGISAESAARMADFAGVAQVALKAGNSTSDAISGRMGVGAQNSAITYANNGQGAGLWVTPIYMNSDSDGFEAQGISYGTDINLYGVALGGDYTLANGIRVGAMFNVGSGDVDGQGAGSNVSSDFDYYGFGLYAGYTMGQFSIVGDVSYTAVDNDLEANTEFADIGKLETSLDSSNISFGVTGSYAFDTAAGVKVTPHVGLRYSYIDIDDYTVDSKAGAIGSYSADSLSVFSIPVGVTIASEFNAGSWSVKPSFDLTLTGNFGDDENEGTFHWAGVENIDSSLNSEIFDNFTYGATLGVAAQSASGISLGLSVGYTGSSNVDDFGVNANARFTF